MDVACLSDTEAYQISQSEVLEALSVPALLDIARGVH